MTKITNMKKTNFQNPHIQPFNSHSHKANLTNYVILVHVHISVA